MEYRSNQRTKEKQMGIVLRYENPEKITVHEVACILCKEKAVEETIPMKRQGQDWLLEKNLPPGEHRYAFLINGNLRLNDPKANMYAPDDHETIWSVLLIDEAGQRLYNNQEYQLHIDAYLLSSFLSETPSGRSKKVFNKRIDPKVAAGFTFKEVTGLHCVTVAWYKPDNTLDRFSEQYLVEPETKDEKIHLWFWMDLKGSEREVSIGKWTLRLFIDGRYILEDSFMIHEESVYGPFNK